MQHRIVVIDDDPDCCETLRELLGFDDHAVWTAHTGRAGLLAAREHRASVVVCDIQLPDISGLDVPRHLAATLQLPPLCIALSGFTDKAAQAASLAAGYAVHLTKPLDFAALRQLLARELSEAERLRAAELST